MLLQLLRGAGVKGLAAMPVREDADRGSRVEEDKREAASPIPIPRSSILRPLLDVTRSEIEPTRSARRLEWIEDESNADIAFHAQLPAARGAAAHRAAVSRRIARRSRAPPGISPKPTALLDELAAADGAGCLDDGTLDVAALRAAVAGARAEPAALFPRRATAWPCPTPSALDEALRQALQRAGATRRCWSISGAASCGASRARLHVVPRPRGAARRLTRGAGAASAGSPLPELGGVLTMAPRAGRGHEPGAAARARRSRSGCGAAASACSPTAAARGAR